MRSDTRARERTLAKTRRSRTPHDGPRNEAHTRRATARARAAAAPPSSERGAAAVEAHARARASVSAGADSARRSPARAERLPMRRGARLPSSAAAPVERGGALREPRKRALVAAALSAGRGAGEVHWRGEARADEREREAPPRASSQLVQSRRAALPTRARRRRHARRARTHERAAGERRRGRGGGVGGERAHARDAVTRCHTQR